MVSEETQELIDEVRKLRETAELLVDNVEDVAGSIRYMTNNLLDDQYHPEMAESVRSLAANVGQLLSSGNSTASLPTFTGQVAEVTERCQDCLEAEASSSNAETIDSEEGEGGKAEPAATQNNGHHSQATKQSLLFDGSDNAASSGTTAVAEPPVSESRESQAVGMDSLDSHQRPYTRENWKEFHKRLDGGDITAEELKQEFALMKANEETIVETLVKDYNAQQLKNWAGRWGRRPESRKADNAKSIYDAMLQTFSLGQTISYRPFEGESYGDAVTRAVDQVTDEEIAAHATKHLEEQAAHEKAITNPETFEEWRLYVRSIEGGYRNLDSAQKIAYERVCADRSRQERADRKEKTIGQIELDEDLAFTMKEGYHDKKDKPLWIVQLSNRVERDTFKQLKAKAQELGGWYSSFKKNDEGFQFWDESAAKLFTELLDGDVDNAEAVAARKIRKMDNASERLAAVADTLEAKCQAVLESDETKLKNTVRRADMAAGMREDAQQGLATVKTLRALSQQLADEDIKYLDGVNAATQLSTLTSRMRLGKYARIRDLLSKQDNDQHNFENHRRHEELSEDPLCEEDIAFAEYPYPYLYRGHLEQAFAKLGSTPGVMRSTKKMQRLIKTADPEKDSIQFRNSAAVEVLADFLQRAKSAGYDCYWFDRCLEDYKRLRTANIHNVFELRTAMRELLPYVAKLEGDDPVVTAEDELRGKKLPGFFPTPKPVVYEMLKLADIQGTDRVLEPSAGKGDILDAVRQAHPDVDLKGIEFNRTLRDVLVAKGYEDSVEFGDFLEQQGEFDKIVMNPPFEKGADIEHVQHAYQLLAPGGRVVSVMCEGPFFRSDAKSTEFRAWLDDLAAETEELPEDAFTGVESFRQTGVKTRLVVIDKA